VDNFKKETNELNYAASRDFFAVKKRACKNFPVANFESVFLFPILPRKFCARDVFR